MTEFEINKKVAQKLGLEFKCSKSLGYITVYETLFDPCNNAEQAWEIMLDNDISITKYDDDFIALTCLSSRYGHFFTNKFFTMFFDLFF